jgi:predicted transcriptional regulator
MLGSLEREIVAVLKEIREGNTRQILEAVNRRVKPVAYTTVSTILMRLHTKGILDRRSEAFKGGERYVYLYKDIEEAYIDNLLGGLVSVFGRPGVVHLAEKIEGLSEDDLRRLRERLKA